MKRIFKSLLLITLVLSTTNAFGMMNWLRSLGGCKGTAVQRSSTPMEIEASTSDESKDQELLSTELAIHDHKKLYTLLYDLISTMPPELIRIILDYDAYELKGVNKHSLSGAFCDHTNSLVKLPNEVVTIQEGNDNIHLWDTKTGAVIKTIKTTEASPLAYNDNKLILASGQIYNNLHKAWLEHYDCTTNQRCAYYDLDQIKGVRLFAQMSPQLFAIGSASGQIALLDTAANTIRTIRKPGGSHIKNLARLSDTVLVIATQQWSCDGQNNGLELWNIENGTCFFTVPKKNTVKNFVWLSEKIFALTALISDPKSTHDEWAIEIWYWNQTAARCIKTIKTGKYELSALAKLSNGYLAAGLRTYGKNHRDKDRAHENLIKVFDPVTAECKAQCGQNTDDAIHCLQPLSNGHLASLSFDYQTHLGTLTHWE